MARLACCLGALAVWAMAGCTLDRSVPARGRGTMFDGGRDASAAELDAWRDLRIDGGGCSLGCGVNEFCGLDGLCHCNVDLCCPDCPAGEVCDLGVCQRVTPTCGGEGQACCDPAASCEAGLACVDGSCADCGNTDQPCCGGACSFSELACRADRCTPCGELDQPCCAGDVCAGGLACGGGACSPPCGGDGEPCCEGTTCEASLGCDAGRCSSACGGPMEDCCDGGVCATHHGCGLGRCYRCGGGAEACCPGFSCDSGHACIALVCV